MTRRTVNQELHELWDAVVVAHSKERIATGAARYGDITKLEADLKRRWPAIARKLGK